MTLFEGREVDGITVKLKSLEVAAHDTFHLGAEVYVLTRATIVAIEHPDKDGSLFRCQVAKPEDGWLVPQLTAARMIDAVEPPKLPSTERVHDKSEDATLDVQVGDDGSVTFIDTTTGEKHQAEPDEETARKIAEAVGRGDFTIDPPDAAVGPSMTDDEARAHVAAADIVCTQHGDEPEDGCFSCAVAAMPDGSTVEERFEQAQGADTEPVVAEVVDPEPVNRIEAAADKPASMIQRVALTKNILAFTEKLTEDFLAWQRKNGIPLNPEHMTFDQARRCLVFVGDIKNAEVEDG